MSDDRTDVLLVSVNDVETKALLSAFGPAGKKPTGKNIGGRIYFDLDAVNGTQLRLTQCEMGASGRGAAQDALSAAIADLSPTSVVMVGVAFGIDEKKQKVGEVLVAKQLLLYELQKIGTDKDGNETIKLRGDKPHVSTRLLNHLRGAEKTWDGATVQFGSILSGAKLVNNHDYRARLKTFDTEAIGGEMEGEGLYVACEARKIDWILVKAICDFADGNKDVDKEARQKLAAGNAAAFVRHALEFATMKTEAPADMRAPLGRGGAGGNARVGGNGVAVGGRGGDGGRRGGDGGGAEVVGDGEAHGGKGGDSD